MPSLQPDNSVTKPSVAKIYSSQSNNQNKVSFSEAGSRDLQPDNNETNPSIAKIYSSQSSKQNEMSVTEGEIEAARKRFAAANSQASAAFTNLESMKQMLINAQSMYNSAEKERKDAHSMLAEVEKRWDQYYDSNPTTEGSSNKKRKVSFSPQANNNTIIGSVTNSGTSALATRSIPKNSRTEKVQVVHIPNRKSTSIPTGQSAVSSNDTAATRRPANNNYVRADRSTNTSNSKNVNRIIVEGCGVPEVNGTYRKVVRQVAQSKYSIRWEKKLVRGSVVTPFEILNATLGGKMKWCIARQDQWDPNTRTYCLASRYESDYDDTNCMVPPESGWRVTVNSTAQYPAPTMRQRWYQPGA